MHPDPRQIGLAAALLASLLVCSSSRVVAATAPSLPKPLVLTLEIEREETPSEPEEPTSDEGVTWDSSGEVSTEDYEACLAKAVEFTKQCDEVAHRWATEDCKRSNHQSNCANWKVSCFSPHTPYWVFSEIGCSSPGFYQCAAATYPGYIGCVDGCNTAKDRVACMVQRCQVQAKTSLSQCGESGTKAGTWREPTGGTPDAQPGSDREVMAAAGTGAGTAAGGLGTMTEIGKGGLVAGRVWAPSWARAARSPKGASSCSPNTGRPCLRNALVLPVP